MSESFLCALSLSLQRVYEYMRKCMKMWPFSCDHLFGTITEMIKAKENTSFSWIPTVEQLRCCYHRQDLWYYRT